jgi:hypothetical protein
MSRTALDEINPDRLTRVRSEVDRLLGCISEAADHYRALGVSRGASIEEIRQAYRNAVEHLHPLKCRDVIEIDGSMQWKLSQAFLRVVEAFTTLSRPARRIEYDAVLNRRPAPPLPIPSVPETLVPYTAEESKAIALPGEHAGEKRALGSAFGHSERSIPRVADRRRVIRFALRLPVRVTSPDNEWQEITESRDVSRLGIRIILSRAVDPGSELQIELPMPEYLRISNRGETVYRITAAVRYVTGHTGAGYLVGAEFVTDSVKEDSEPVE